MRNPGNHLLTLPDLLLLQESQSPHPLLPHFRALRQPLGLEESPGLWVKREGSSLTSPLSAV